MKVKEPQAVERAMLRENQVLFTYLHLAPDPDQTKDLVDSGAICIAYETVTVAMAVFHCLPRCQRSQVACRSRLERMLSRHPTVERDCYWAVFLASPQRRPS